LTLNDVGALTIAPEIHYAGISSLPVSRVNQSK